MKSTFVLFALATLVSCSKSSPQIEKVENEIIEINSNLRVYEEEFSKDLVLNSNNIGKTVTEIESYYSQDFKWHKFWRLLEADISKIDKDYLLPLARLSVVSCSEVNTESYVSFINKYAVVHALNVNKQIQAYDDHIIECGRFYTIEMHRALQAEIDSQKTSEIDSDVYLSYIQRVDKKTNLITRFDKNEILNDKLFTRSMKASFSKKDIGSFLSMAGIYKAAFPTMEITNIINITDRDLTAEQVLAIAKKNSLSSLLNLLKLVNKENYLITDKSFEEILNGLLGEYFSDNRVSKITAEVYLRDAGLFVDFLKLNSSTTKDKSQTVDTANKLIKKLFRTYTKFQVVDALDGMESGNSFHIYIKKLYVEEFQPDFNEQSLANNFLDRVHQLLINIRSEESHGIKSTHLKKLCTEFEKIGLKDKFSKMSDDNFVGCNRVSLKGELHKETLFSLYGVYQSNDEQDIVLEAESINGGVFDLSTMKKREKRAPKDFGKDLDAILLPFFFKVTLGSNGSEVDAILPYIYEYQSANETVFSWSDYEAPLDGFDSHNLIIDSSKFIHIKPALVSYGGKGQKGYEAPSDLPEMSFTYDFSDLEDNAPFEIDFLEKDWITNRSYKKAFESTTKDRFLRLDDMSYLDFLLNNQRSDAMENLNYINMNETLGCKKNDFECIYENLYPIIDKEVTDLIAKNLKDNDLHEKFRTSRKVLPVTVLTSQEDGLRGQNGTLTFR